MPAHDKAYARLNEKVRAAYERGDLKAADHYLDQRLHMEFHATNWDAHKWGLDPDDEMWDQLAETEG